MSEADPILRAVLGAIAELNAMLPVDRAVGTSEDAPLAAMLDSLGVVNLLLAVEGQIEQSTGVAVSLTDLLEQNPEGTPLETVGTFARLVRERVEGATR